MRIATFDTNHHPTPIFREFGVGLEALGHSWSFYPIEAFSLSSLSTQFDIVFYVGPAPAAEIAKFKERFPSTVLIYAADTWRNDLEGYKVDYILTTQSESPVMEAEFVSRGFKVVRCPLAANEKVFYPLFMEKDIDVSFIGTLAHGDRGEAKYLYPILDNPAYKCYLAGMSYKNHGGFHLQYNETNLIRSRSKINLNFHTDFQKPKLGHPVGRVDLNQSVFNIALAGGFQICDHPLAKTLFEGTVIVPDDKDWCDCVEYYLNNQEEREVLAELSHQIAVRSHTWEERMKSLLCSIHLS